MKADLAIYTLMLGVPGQYESVALMLRHKIDFHCCLNRGGFCKSSHIYSVKIRIVLQCQKHRHATNESGLQD